MISAEQLDALEPQMRQVMRKRGVNAAFTPRLPIRRVTLASNVNSLAVSTAL